MATEQQLSNNVTRVASPITTVDQVDAKISLALALRNELPAGITLLAPGTEEYEAERTSWNLDVVHRPAVMAQPRTTDDVSHIVRAAVKLGARLTIAGGRHGHDCLADDALVLDLSRMTKVVVDEAAKEVR